MSKYHELTQKLWEGDPADYEKDDRIIREWLGEKAKEFMFNLPYTRKGIRSILGLGLEEVEWVDNPVAKLNIIPKPIPGDADVKWSDKLLPTTEGKGEMCRSTMHQPQQIKWCCPICEIDRQRQELSFEERVAEAIKKELPSVVYNSVFFKIKNLKNMAQAAIKVIQEEKGKSSI